MRKWAHRLQSVALSPGCNKRRGSLQVLKVVGATGILGNDVVNFKEAERELPAVSAAQQNPAVAGFRCRSCASRRVTRRRS